jgi:hypothetical protein
MFYPHKYETPTLNYLRKTKFPYLNIALLPTVLYQGRVRPKKCGEKKMKSGENQGGIAGLFHSLVLAISQASGEGAAGARTSASGIASAFADLYNQQKNAPASPMFGNNAEKDVHLDDPTDGLVVCRNGYDIQDDLRDKIIMTDMYKFRGDPVYAMFAAVENVAMLSRSSWVDLLTSHVQIASLVYTQGNEFFTLVRVNFDVDSSGAIGAVAQLDTVVDLRSRGEEDTVAFYMNIAMALAAIGIFDLLVLMTTNCLEEKNVKKKLTRFRNEFLASETLYAMVLRLVVVFYGNWFISSLRAQPSLIYEYNHIMDIFTTPPDYGTRQRRQRQRGRERRKRRKRPQETGVHRRRTIRRSCDSRWVLRNPR